MAAENKSGRSSSSQDRFPFSAQISDRPLQSSTPGWVRMFFCVEWGNQPISRAAEPLFFSIIRVYFVFSRLFFIKPLFLRFVLISQPLNSEHPAAHSHLTTSPLTFLPKVNLLLPQYAIIRVT